MSRVTFGAGHSQSKQGNAFQKGHSQNKHLASIEIVGWEVLLGGGGGFNTQNIKMVSCFWSTKIPTKLKVPHLTSHNLFLNSKA
jgi:hypothetical protein